MLNLPPPLTGQSWHRGGADRRDHLWLVNALQRPETRVMLTHRNKVLLCGNALVPLTIAELKDRQSDALLSWDSAVWLGQVDGVDWVAFPPAHHVGPHEVAATFSAQWGDVRATALNMSSLEASLATTAVAVQTWSSTHRYCPECGSETTVTDGGWVRVCTAEGHEQYPRMDPAVIVLILDDEDRVLLGHNVAWAPRRFSTFAGFVEPGEGLEDTVRREMKEETGFDVGQVTYLGSQPWPFPRSLMLAFQARVVSGELTTNPDEIDQARWFTRAELPEAVAAGEVILPRGVAIAASMLESWYGSPLPVGEDQWR